MNWLALLRERVDAVGVVAVAAELQMANHTAISLVLSGKYPARTDRIVLRVLTRYASLRCPFLDQEITFAACRELHEAEAPTSSQFEMRHWKHCQQCPNNKSRRAA